jgi:hypothetical protein
MFRVRASERVQADQFFMGAEIDQSELERVFVSAQLQRESTIRRTILDDLTCVCRNR